MRAMVLALLVCGCGSEAERSYSGLHKAACAGDFDAVMAQVDEAKMVQSVAATMKEKTPGAVAELAAKKAWDETREQWRTEIAKKGEGLICKWERVGAEGAEVVIKRPSGKLARLTFEGGKLVAYRGVD